MKDWELNDDTEQIKKDNLKHSTDNTVTCHKNNKIIKKIKQQQNVKEKQYQNSWDSFKINNDEKEEYGTKIYEKINAGKYRQEVKLKITTKHK